MPLRHLLKNLFKIKIGFACTLFSFEGSMGGCSSVGRAPALQAGGQEFESPHLHQGMGS